MWWIVLGLLSISASIFFWSLVAVSGRDDRDVQEVGEGVIQEQEYFAHSNHVPPQTA